MLLSASVLLAASGCVSTVSISREVWQPDDPRWLSIEPDIQPVDLQVLRQVGVPELVLQLALRRAGTATGNRPGGGPVVAPITPDLSFLDELVEDPDARPYIWDLPEECY